jgi:hypothetical protein
MGLIYCGWDDKDEPDYYNPTYLAQKWSNVDTCALLVCWFIGQIVICLHIVKGLFSTASRHSLISGVHIFFGLVCVACIGILCIYLDEESSAFWTFTWAMVCVMELGVSIVFGVIYYLMVLKNKPQGSTGNAADPISTPPS